MLKLLACVVFADETVDYQTQVRHVFQERCFACHGALKQEGGLRIDTADSAIVGGDSGSAIVAGDASASLLFHRISANDLAERMPPEGEALKPAEIDAIQRWINQGAKAPADESPESDPRDHWAFRAPVRSKIPQVQNEIWNQNPIDAFIAASHEHRHLVPQPAADKRIWLRRVSYDLVGLPPTLEEQSAFLNDDSPEAYDTVVTRLLESPQHGARWGRHWMDIWRYSDWWGLGAEVRNSQKHIWHWRDWVIESVNSDKSYDQMLREMLAADELYPNDPDRLRASGFLARQYFKFNRTSWMDDTIQHTFKAMLGLTFNCAKCHDHKYDPISQVNYYQLRAFFEPYQIRTDVIGSELDFEKDGLPRAFDCNLDAPTYLHVRGDDRNPDLNLAIHPAVPDFLAFKELAIEPVAMPSKAWNPGLRSTVVEAHLQAANRKIHDAQEVLTQARAQLLASQEAAEVSAVEEAANSKEDDKLQSVEQASLLVRIAEAALRKQEAELASIRARSAADQTMVEAPDTAETHALVAAAVKAERIVLAEAAHHSALLAEQNLLAATAEKRAAEEAKIAAAKAALQTARAAIDTPGDSHTPLTGALKTLENNLETEQSRRKPFPRTSTGRRTALAAWMTDRDNPLTARVAVNHIWMRHFGTPLVPTVFDLGRKGIPPTHPELLDWLAVELMESGWSMKHLHHLIVTSQAYRMASTRANAAEINLKSDSENRCYWRTNPIRMEAQLVRDSLLYLAEQLDLTLGGPSVPVNEDKSLRRSLYYVHSHNEHQKFLSMFDDANVLECYRRADSIVPQQALALENSTLANELAVKIAAKVSGLPTVNSDDAFIRAGFRMVLSVDASEQEVAASLQAMNELRKTGSGSDDDSENSTTKARTMLIHALINHNDFVTIR